MSETRKIAAILVADIVGYSRLAGADEDRILARLRALRSDLIDPTIAVHHGRVVKRTGDGSLIEFRSVVNAVRCAIEVQNGLIERNAGLPPERRIEFRVGVHLGDVVEEADGDLMGDGVNIAARLEGICEPGAICLSEDAYRQVKGRLDLAVHDLGPTQLKNIAEPIRVYALDVSAQAVAKSAPAPGPEKSAPPRLSIVVLPFANIGGDPEQEHFVDGVTESLTTDLSRISGAYVVARNTAFTYKGKPLDVKTIGRELNVRYVLEGSVQRGGNRMRVNVQLVDAETGNHLWAERFDKPLADLFDMQDEIVARLANALNAQLVAAEARRAERTPNPDSMDLYFQGAAWFNKGTTPDNVAQARSFYDRALTADPDNVEALIGSARADARAGAFLFLTDPITAFAAAEAKLTKALSSVPDHALGHMLLGLVDMYTKRAAQGIAECEHALALDRNLAHAYAIIGRGKIFVGRAEETEAHVAEAMRLSPRDTLAYIWMTNAGMAKLHLGDWEQAVAWFRRAIEANRNHPHAYFVLSAALAQFGRIEEARSAVKAGLALDPAFAISRFHAAWVARSDDPTYVAQLEPILEGMRKAGVPEIMTATRRLAAILAADVVGYSRLMGEDEAGTARAVRERREAARPIVASHGGRIVKTTGDGLLMEFPSVVAAVECAIAIQKLMAERNAGLAEAKRILYRVGVNLGDVLIEGDDILGDGVNIAARLEGIAEPGGILISGAAYDHVRGRVDAHFIDLGEKNLKNIAQPLRVYAIEAGSESGTFAPSAAAPSKPEPPHLSIVVLPFANMTGDPGQEYFVDGVTESLTTDLSRRGSFVIGRNTAFTYKGKHVDLKQIGRELSVRYVLEGSVQRAGNRMRFSAQLIDAESGNHLWADRFDKPLADLFDMQDEIVARLANVVTTQVTAAEARRAERVPNPDSVDLTSQGWAWWDKGITPDNLAEARRLFERALALDSADIWALVGIANVDAVAAITFHPDDRAARLANAEAVLTTALSLAPDNAVAHMCQGIVQIHTNRVLQGIREFERTLELDRNLANAHGQIGAAKILLGRAEDTEAHVQQALRLSPRDVLVYLWCMFVGWAKLYLGQEEEAVAWLRRSIETNRNFPMSHFLLAAALADVGQLPEARTEAQAGLSIHPTFTIARIRATASSDNPDYCAQRERFIDGLRKTGIPEE